MELKCADARLFLLETLAQIAPKLTAEGHTEAYVLLQVWLGEAHESAANFSTAAQFIESCSKTRSPNRKL